MTDFRKWDKFDADAVEAEIEHNAQLAQATRARIAEEQSVLNHCDARVATLKSEAAVRALRAKRALRKGRQRSHPSTDHQHCHPNHLEEQQQSPQPPQQRQKADGKPTHSASGQRGPEGGDCNMAVLAARAKEQAENMESLARNLRHALEMRDEVVALAEAGDLYRGVNKARQCQLELNTAQRTLLLLSTAPRTTTESNVAGTGDTSASGCVANDVAASSGRSSKSNSAGNTHSHDHDHHHGQQCSHGHESHASQSPCYGASSTADDSGSGGSAGDVVSSGLGKDRRRKGALQESDRVMRVVRRSKAVCRVAEAGCLVRANRAAQATEALRDLLLEDPESVPAWVARGEAFLAMGNPLIAGLHFDRALALDPTCEEAIAHRKTLRVWDAKVATVAGASGDKASQDESGPRPGTDGASTPECVRSSSIAKSVSDAILRPVTEGGVEGAVDHSSGEAEREREQVLSKAGRDGVAAAVPLSAVLSRTGNSNAGSGGGDGEVGLRSSSVRVLLVKACQEYREGVVLHQEAFLMSSSVKFTRVLMRLDQVESIVASSTSTRPTIAQAAAAGREGTEGGRSEGAPMVGPGGGSAGVGDSAGESAMKNVRVACHLNIAAAVLLRQRDYEVAVDHCNRALQLEPGNTQALVRRAQAHGALGYFRLAVEDLEAAEACLAEGMGELIEVRKRLRHARWTKIHVGNGKDELPLVSGGRDPGEGVKTPSQHEVDDSNTTSSSKNSSSGSINGAEAATAF